MSRVDPGLRANFVGVGVNVGLAVAKLVVGVIAGSQALVADGYNSAGDVVATAIAAGAYRFAMQPADDNHPYGHGNAESVAGLVIGVLLFATGGYITLSGAVALAQGVTEPPGFWALPVAAATIVVKELLYRYTIAVGRRLNSPSLKASARDHRADVASALAVLLGVAGARMGLPWLDPVAAMLIGVWIAWMAMEPIRENLGVLMDESDPAQAERIRLLAREVDEVREVSDVRVHPMGSYVVVDLEIFVDGSLSLFEAHELAHAVEEHVKTREEHVVDVTVHVNPTGLRD